MNLIPLLTLSACLLAGHGLLGDLSVAAASETAGHPATSPTATDDPEAAVATAIAQLRGVRLKELSEAQKSALGERLDKAWDALFDHPDAAKKAIRAVMATEQADSYLLIDLAHLWTNLEPQSLQPAAGALLKADVTENPGGTFHAASRMAALHCGDCLPAVLRILEIKDPDTQIAQHALPINQDLMLVFTIGQYGTDSVGPVIAKLSSDSCVVRANAGLALGLLQPVSIPGDLRRMAVEDGCEDARAGAWTALGLLDDPLLARSAAKQLNRSPEPSKAERRAIARALGSSFSQAAKQPLASLATDPDPEVASDAKKALAGLQALEQQMAKLRVGRAGASSSKRSKVIRQLEKAVRDGRIEPEIEREQLLLTLTAADLPLLNRARAAVLGRLSDECLYEYYPLTYAARALRNGSTTGPATATPDLAAEPERNR